MNHHQINRRQTIKLITYATLTTLTHNQLTQQKTHADIRTQPTTTTGALHLNLNNHPTLQQPNGTLRIHINPLHTNHQPNGPFHPIQINRLPNNTLIALNTECPHASCAIQPPKNQTHHCPCHNSQFNLQGKHLTGPANNNLQTYKLTHTQHNHIQIHIPKLGFTTNACLQKNQHNQTTLQLHFPARHNITYQTIHKPNHNTPWQPTTFSLNPNTPPTHTQITGNNNLQKIYLHPTTPTGFYAIQIKTKTQ